MTPRWTIAFDADDTLWHNERFFRAVTAEFETLLSSHCDPENLSVRLNAAEKRNLRIYGYGIKGFTLSLIETAIEVGGDKLPVSVIEQILTMGRDMLDHPIELLPHVETVLPALAEDFELLVITKGDLLHQETKIAQSGLGHLFNAVEIVSEKTAETYQHIFARYDTPRIMMVGNSLKSDVIPAIEAGAWGVWLSQNLTWDFEHSSPPIDQPKYCEIHDFSELPGLLDRLGR
jgi:putative hydrolase of the HAD superfamily